MTFRTLLADACFTGLVQEVTTIMDPVIAFLENGNFCSAASFESAAKSVQNGCADDHLPPTEGAAESGADKLGQELGKEGVADPEGAASLQNGQSDDVKDKEDEAKDGAEDAKPEADEEAQEKNESASAIMQTPLLNPVMDSSNLAFVKSVLVECRQILHNLGS